MVIFSEQVSEVTAIVAMMGAYVLTSGLRATVPLLSAPAGVQAPPAKFGGELFAGSLYQPPVPPAGYVIAIGLYAAGAALLLHAYATGALLLASVASTFAWNSSLEPAESFNRNTAYRKAAARLAGVLIVAVLITAWALLDGVAQRNRTTESVARLTTSKGRPKIEGDERRALTVSSGGYESVILFPYPAKERIVTPLLFERALLSPGSKQPLIIRFDGTYRYVQPPDRLPGPDAHRAQGSPLNVDIESTNSIPLVMDAHQNLASAISTAHCREIQVEIENRDNRAGVISLALLLTNGASPPAGTLYLGQQPIVSTEPNHFSFKPAPTHEALRFSVPASAGLSVFDQITVLVLPDIEHAFVAPKIAIEQFRLFPR